MTLIHTLLFEEENVDSASQLNQELRIFSEFIKIIELGDPNQLPKGIFTVLEDHVDTMNLNEYIRGEYTVLESAEQALDLAFMDKQSLEDIQLAFVHFQHINLIHLEKKENRIQFLFQQLKEIKIDWKELMMKEILPFIVNSPSYRFCVQYSYRILVKMNKIDVFDQVLMSLCGSSSNQRLLWEGWIQESPQAQTIQHTMTSVVHDAF